MEGISIFIKEYEKTDQIFLNERWITKSIAAVEEIIKLEKVKDD